MSIDPLNDEFPTDSNWKILTKDVQFNIPFSAIMDAIAAGKFPLLDAIHDLSHFVTFLRFPELTAAIIRRVKDAKADDFTPGFKRRQYWLTESLSVLDPESGSDGKRFLKLNGRAETQTIEDAEEKLGHIKTSELADYGLKLADYVDSKLRDISGGNANSSEKWFYLSEVFGLSPEQLVNLQLESASSAVLKKVKELSQTYFNNGPVTLNANPKPMTNETVVFNFTTFNQALKILSIKASVSRLSKWEKEALIKFIARTELLLKTPPPTYEEWADSFLRPDLPADDPVSNLLLAVFGSNIVRDFYLGPGRKREK